MELRIVVAGDLPPTKGEAKSMLSVGHGQRARVRLLLQRASEAMVDRGLLDGPIGLDVTVTAARDARLPDATNMLGGIGDVLQARTAGANIEHLGALAHVACFHDDAQIQQIRFVRVEDDEIGYLIVIRSLDASEGCA